jgi:hypothetical protein
MFPDPCGAALAEAVRNGADPRMVVPDEYFVVRGGIKPLPPARTVFSAVTGPTLEAAACAVPNNQLRAASARLIRANGGSVEWLAEYSPHGTLNEQHVNMIEYASTSFSEPQPNPVSKKLRIDAGA